VKSGEDAPEWGAAGLTDRQGIDGAAMWQRSKAISDGRWSAVAPMGSYSFVDKR
jgi:hypothetical protein